MGTKTREMFQPLRLSRSALALASSLFAMMQLTVILIALGFLPGGSRLFLFA